MLKALLSLSLVTSLTTSAFADRVAVSTSHFAQPPHAYRVEQERDLIAPVLDRAAVRDALMYTRATNLAAFRAYQKKGVFPSNTYRGSKLNVWRDEDGHFCAAATIIKMSGQDALVNRVAEQSNFIRLADVTSGPLMDWILTSGFTQDEIAMIQEPFMPVTEKPRPEPVDPVVVDARMRAKENARLRVKYTQVEASLVKSERKSIELAVDRLMKRPQLAMALVAKVGAQTAE